MLCPELRQILLVGWFFVVLISSASALAAPRDPNGSIPPQLLPAAKNRSPEERTRAAEQALERALTVNWEEMTFAQVIKQLSATLEVPMVLDSEGLDEAGVTSDQLVTFQLEDVRAGALLDLLLEPLHLTYEVRHGLFIITSEEKAAENLVTQVYNVRDLLAISSSPPQTKTAKTESVGSETAVGFFCFPSSVINKPRPAWWDALMEDNPPPPKEATPAESLMAAITETVEADTWTSAGGQGSLRVYGGLLIVTQNGRTLKKVESLLRDLRKTHAETAVEPVAKP